MDWTRPARTEFLARRYLASRGRAPMVQDPLHDAVPRLHAEALAALWLARIDVMLAVGLTLAGMAVAVAVVMAPLHGGMLLVMAEMHIVLALGVAVAIWAAIVLEKSAPRMVAARRIIQSLQSGAMLEALELALRALPTRRAGA
jgi:hypothetical protein